MPTSTLTSKGQVTVPKSIRDALKLRPGDQVAFVRHHDGRITFEAINVDLRSLRGSVKSSVRGVTLQDMEDAIAEGAIASAALDPPPPFGPKRVPAATRGGSTQKNASRGRRAGSGRS